MVLKDTMLVQLQLENVQLSFFRDRYISSLLMSKMIACQQRGLIKSPHSIASTVSPYGL